MMKLSETNKYIITVNSISIMVAFITHFPEMISLTDPPGESTFFHGMEPADVVVEILFTYVSLLILYFINERLFHFAKGSGDIGWGKVLGSFVITWIASSLMGKGFVFVHHHMGIPAIDATMHHYLHPLRDFLISVMVTGSSDLMYLSRKSGKIQFENQQLRAENIENQYEALKSQLNPHMLFNSLNTLSALIRESPDKAQQYLQELSRVLRYTLQDNSTHTVLLSEEMDFVNSYIYLLKMRYEDNLEFDIEISAEAMHRKVPPMSVQMLVENAVKHNEISNRKPLRISIFTEGDTLSVCNPLQPRMSGGNGLRIGLDNLSRRFRLLFHKDIEIKTGQNVFSVTIPLV